MKGPTPTENKDGTCSCCSENSVVTRSIFGREYCVKCKPAIFDPVYWVNVNAVQRHAHQHIVRIDPASKV